MPPVWLFLGHASWTTAHSHTCCLSVWPPPLTTETQLPNSRYSLACLPPLPSTGWVRVESKHRTRLLLCQVGSQIFIKLEGPLEFPSLLWVNKAHRSIFGSPCPFSFQLLRSSMNNIFWVFFFWLNCQHDLSCSIFFPLPSVNNGLSAELCANIHLDNLPKGVGR